LPEAGLASLIAKGRAQGSLTTGDVFDALPDVEPSPGQLDAIYNHIRASGIELVDEIAADLEAEDGDDDLPPAAGVAETPAISIPIPIPLVPVPTPEAPAAPEPAAAAPAPLARPRRAPRSEPAAGENVRPDRAGEGGVSDPV